MNFKAQNLVIYYDLRRESCRELASDAAFLSAYAEIRILMGMIKSEGNSNEDSEERRQSSAL